MECCCPGLLRKIERLPAERISEVEDFVDFIAVRETAQREARLWRLASKPALTAVWDNADDDAYDAL